MLSTIGRAIDNAFVRSLGVAYTRISRDRYIYERTVFLTECIRRFCSGRFSLLDAGCGSGLALLNLERDFGTACREYVGFDLAARRLEPRYRSIGIDHRFENIDIDRDFDLGEFDVVWCSEVIEHLLDDQGAVMKLSRAAKPGGIVVLTVPSLAYVNHVTPYVPFMGIPSVTQDGGHVRLGYAPAGLQRLGTAAGLEMIAIAGVSACTPQDTVARYKPAAFPFATWLKRTLFNAKLGATRRPDDEYVFGLDEAILCQYLSLAAVFKKP